MHDDDDDDDEREEDIVAAGDAAADVNDYGVTDGNGDAMMMLMMLLMSASSPFAVLSRFPLNTNGSILAIFARLINDHCTAGGSANRAAHALSVNCPPCQLS